MLQRCAILGITVLGVILILDVGSASYRDPASADDGESSYTGDGVVHEATPGPHFAYQQGLLAQASGIAPLTLPQHSERRERPPRGPMANVVMPTPLPSMRDTVSAIRDILVEAKKANPGLSPRDVKAAVQDGDFIKIVVECNCNPKPLLVGTMAPETPVRYLTFTIDRRYLGHRITAGPDSPDVQDLIRRGPR